MSESTEDGGDAWRPIATRGELAMLIVTAQRAQQDGLPIAPGAQFVGVLLPDGGKRIEVNFLSLASLREFVDEMAPRQLDIAGATGEDEAALHAVLARDPRASMH